jgi:hypothetical protein
VREKAGELLYHSEPFQKLIADMGGTIPADWWAANEQQIWNR